MTRRVPLIIVALAVALTVAFWYLLYQPATANQAGYVAEIAKLEDERGQLQSRIASLREVEANAEDYRSQVTRLTEYIPDSPAQPEALAELQRVADESGVTITELTFADPEAVADAPPTGDDKTTLARVPTLLTVEGGFFQVVDLLRRIEVDLGRAFKIDTATIDEAEETFPRLIASLNGQIFAVLPLAEVATVDGQPAQPATASEGATEAPSDGTSAPDQPTEGAPPANAPANAPDGTTDVGTS